MTERKRELFFLTGIFTAGFLFCAVILSVGFRWSEGLFYDRAAALAASFPGEEDKVMRALKGVAGGDLLAGKEALRRYGYEGRLPMEGKYPVLGAASLVFAGLFAGAFSIYLHRRRTELQRRTGNLTEYLRRVEEGDYSISPEKKQDDFSNLEDEIYKTVLALRESREKLRQEKEKLADNLADISHQFKTPLTSLSVLSELLLRHLSGTEEETGRPAEPVRRMEGKTGRPVELVRRMEGQTGRLTELTAALLTLSKADAGVLPFEIREVPVSELIECSLEGVRPLLEEKGQRVKLSGENDSSGHWEPRDFFLACDLGWTREALCNLLKNACEHGPRQSEICIRMWDNPVFAGIAVEDQGTGFSEKDLRHLFDRFYRGEYASGDSTGIGLSLAKTLIESQNGEIRAQNRKEGGARFLIKFYKNV